VAGGDKNIHKEVLHFRLMLLEYPGRSEKGCLGTHRHKKKRLPAEGNFLRELEQKRKL
jgi:hypothetical protein